MLWSSGRKLLPVLLWLLNVPGAVSQTALGRMEVSTYTRQMYAAGTQNWAMTIDRSSRLYVANNEGLLVYDGTNWQLYPVPNHTILRSVAFAPDGKLYAGAQDELGYYAPDRAGRLVYTSLKNGLPPSDNRFADIWDIEITGKEVFFRATDKIFRLAGGRLTVHKPASSWLSLSKHRDMILAQDAQRGLLQFRDGEWKTLIDQTALPTGFVITDLIPFNEDSSLVSTASNGLFLLVQNSIRPFVLKNTPERHLISLDRVDEDHFLAGSYSNGLYQFNREGLVLENITDKNGLQNNTVRCIRAMPNGQVWMGLDNGIAFMNCSNAIRHINPPAFHNGIGYGVKVFNGELYFALSTGLQWQSLSDSTDLSRVTGEPATILHGLTWNLSVAGNQLLAGRDDGAWTIARHQASPIVSSPGYWIYQPLAGNTPGKLVAGHYQGIRFFEEKNGQYSDLGGIQGFPESSRYVETDGRHIWVTHPYRGVYKINADDHRVTKFTQANGLPADLNNHVFKLNNRIVFATPKGIYEYSEKENKMVKAVRYAGLFGERPLRYLKEDGKGNIWFVQDKMIGVADYTEQQPALHFIPELKNRILSGFENIYPYNSRNILIGSESGFYHLNYDQYRQKMQPFETYISLVKITGNADSVLYGGYGDPAEKPAAVPIPHKWNSLHFSFASSSYGREAETEFSCYLEGFDKKWGSWSNQHEKDYTNLPEGTYTLQVKSRIGPSYESGVCTYSFTIAAPWYRTLWAYGLYLLCTAAFLYTLYKLQEKKLRRKQEARRREDLQKYEEEQRRLTYEHQLELEKTEKELIRLKNDKLEAEIEHKNAELAGTAMSLVQKKEFLLKITEELNKIYKPGKETVEAAELNKIIRSLGSEEKLDDEWKQFSIHFDKVHGNFLVNLKQKFPLLNAHELKLCAYLRMNLSSKEMAQLMSISVRGVEISRYRLRKKLQLQPKEDLFQFLLRVEAEG